MKLDITNFLSYKLHKYSLDHFTIQEAFAGNSEIKKYKNIFSRTFVKINQITNNRLCPYYRLSYIKEQGMLFDKNVFNSPSDTYVDGYWQTEKYFKGIESDIRKQFTFKTPPSEKNKQTIERILEKNAVSIHVRRTDFISDAASRSIYSACGIPYYKESVRLIADRVSNPHFFVFSDDMDWTKENLKIDFPTTYVDFNNSETNYEDMRLMSLCKHNITANSTFSWWGAWLNEYDKKIVVTPKKWFNSAARSDIDLVPHGWKKI